MSADRLDSLLSFHPFTRLNALLQDTKPGGEPLAFSIGEPQQAPPPIVAETLQKTAQLWGKYPLATGTVEFRQTASAWLGRRFRLPAGLIDADRHILPVAGTREALFMMALSAVARRPHLDRPAVLMPNPFYHVYAGAAAVAGAEPCFLPATAETGFLPDPQRVPAAVLARTTLAYICSPANPQGAVADLAYLKTWIELARRHDFVVAFDECYSEIYFDGPPPGGLQASAALGGDLDGVMVFHSLSKRSGVPGLRSGFVAGDAALIRRQAQLVNFGGVAVPYPILAASTALWRDEAHVEENRNLYRANFAAAERIMSGRFGFVHPRGGFFQWLAVGDGEQAALRLWRDAGIRVLPGAYMARSDASGRNPGRPYIRVALVHDTETVAKGLARMVSALSAQAVQPTDWADTGRAAGAEVQP